MNKWKRYAIALTLLSLGAVNETLRIFISSDADIADNRSSLIPMAIILTSVCIFFAIRFWIKSDNYKGL